MALNAYPKINSYFFPHSHQGEDVDVRIICTTVVNNTTHARAGTQATGYEYDSTLIKKRKKKNNRLQMKKKDTSDSSTFTDREGQRETESRAAIRGED